MKARLKLLPRTSDGESCPLPVVVLQVRDRYGAFALLRFRVDTQADVMVIPVSEAEKERIPFTRTREGIAVGITGKVKKYRNRVRVVIAGREHDWPCDFTESAIDADTSQRIPDLGPVLGRSGFLREYAITIESEYLIITRMGPIRLWLHRRLHAFWEYCGLVHPATRPL